MSVNAAYHLGILLKAQRLEERIILARGEFEMACKDKDQKAQDEARLKILTMTEANIDLVKEGIEINEKIIAESIQEFKNRFKHP